MTMKLWAKALTRKLRYVLRLFHADSGKSQKEIAALMHITPRVCSDLENEEYGFSVFL